MSELRKPVAIVVVNNATWQDGEKQELTEEISEKLKGTDYEGTPVVCLNAGQFLHVMHP